MSLTTIFYICMHQCEQGVQETFMQGQGVLAQKKVKNHFPRLNNKVLFFK